MQTNDQIVNLSFINEPFEDCETAVDVSLIDVLGRQKERFRMGVVKSVDVYDKIQSGDPICLDRRFVQDFSLSEYRKIFGLDSDAQIELREFSASKAYFEAEHETDFSWSVFVGNSVNFTNCFFGDGPLGFYHAKFNTKKVDFEGCNFGAGIANFQYVDFLCDELIFDHAKFNSGDVQFVSATFGKSKVSFKDVDFGKGIVDFHYSTFGNGNITFDKSRFEGEVSFKRVDFGDGKIDFKRVQFGDGNIDFSEADFKSGKAIFRSCLFGNGSISFEDMISESDFVFDNAEFGSGKLSFFGATARKLSFRLCQFNNYIDLRVKNLEKLDLSYTIVRDIIDLMPTEKCPVNMRELNFSGMRNLGQLYIDWRTNKVLKLIMSQEDSSLHQKSEQFLVLKETYNATGRYADEDKAYIWYKRMELKADLEHSIARDPKNAIWAYPTAFAKWLLFDKIGLYATEPVRVLFSVGIVYTLFSLLYIFLPFVADTYIDTGGGEILADMNHVTKAFYYSAITFLTIGYGEFYPIGIMRLFASIEGYVGIFLMGYFSVAFVRKVLR